MIPNTVIQHSPNAVTLVLDTSIAISVDDGLLRTSAGCTAPALSVTLYVDSLNHTVITNDSDAIIVLNNYRQIILLVSSVIFPTAVLMFPEIT